jgi:hypothetical protein
MVCCRSFLTQYASVLNWNTTTTLLESYGRLEELEVFAGAKGDQEALLEYLMRNPDGAKRYDQGLSIWGAGGDMGSMT